ncbi:MAG TPA: NAD(P)-dependent alcohol dehydrogenase [Phycicoccus sp.]|nr:NAD(P)-dependent alcohol dehydrogenase [Phycicoccus sp.]
MRAAVTTAYGPPEVVRVEEVAEPEVGPGDLLVRVYYGTVNRTDCAYRAAYPWFIRAFSGWTRPKVDVWGTEYAGVVERVGPQVTAFAPGDRVLGYAEGRFGAHAELVAVAQDSMVAHVPDGVDLATAAATTEGGHYALSFLRHSGLMPGDRALVHGATGAIGSAAVQLAADHGVHVTATAPTAHLDLARRLGAEEVVDWEQGGLDRLDGTFDAVLDTVGRSTFGACRRLLGPGGVYLSSELGPFWQNPVLALVTPLGGRRKVVFPIPLEGDDVMVHLVARLGRGAFTPVIDRTFTLDDIVEAYRYAESGRKVGNVLLDVTGSGA